MPGWLNYVTIGNRVTQEQFDIVDDEPRRSPVKLSVNGNRVCPECGRELRVRTNGKTGDKFYGCQGFFDKRERCLYTEPLDAKFAGG